MAKERVEVLFIKDEEGNAYGLPKDILEQFRIPDEVAQKIPSTGTGGEVSGYTIYTRHIVVNTFWGTIGVDATYDSQDKKGQSVAHTPWGDWNYSWWQPS
jgi:hypothetical protein